MPQERQAAAKFMKHGLGTQARYYDLSQSAASDARMANIFSKMVEGQEVPDEELRPQIKRKENSMKSLIKMNAEFGI